MTSEDEARLVLPTPAAQAGGVGVARCTGRWTLAGIGALDRELRTLRCPDAAAWTIDASGISALDTSGAWLLHRLQRRLEAGGGRVGVEGLQPEFRVLQELVATHEPQAVPPTRAPYRGLERVGAATVSGGVALAGGLAFVGEASIALLRTLLQPRRLRWRVVLHHVYLAGVAALPITGFLSFLMGLVIAYQGADQLQRFGANIFVVDLVALAMLRELSPLLTAIIVAGRSGSAYTAQIGTMKVTEEIDALRTIGVAPLEQLVVPKVLALVIALPLLTVYTDLTGVLGGMVMARTKLDIGFGAFVDRLDEAIQLSSYWTGLVKAPVFAAVIALIGCYRGLRVAGSAESVGEQTTASVVQAVFLVIVLDALFSIVFLWLDL